MDLNVRAKSVKLLVFNLRVNPCDFVQTLLRYDIKYKRKNKINWTS